jgi:hypothetical protein
LIAPPYFPVRWPAFPRRFVQETSTARFSRRRAQVDSIPLSHPDGSVAYRVTHGDRRLVFATDHEHGVEKPSIARSSSFCRNADYLIYDATYMQAEYEIAAQGWGHSTWYAAVQVARNADGQDADPLPPPSRAHRRPARRDGADRAPRAPDGRWSRARAWSFSF